MANFEETGYQIFVKIAEKEGSDDIEIPCEKDGAILLSTVQAQFPNAIGLKYRSSSGGWRGIRVSENILDAPLDGWGEIIYYVTVADSRKRRSSSVDERKPKLPAKQDLLQDIIVLGLPFSVDEDALKQYFTSSCGELAFYEIKYDRSTKKSRGFGFIRFKTEEAANEALNGNHEINGRKLEVRLSKQNNEKPMKLFIGRLTTEVTKESLTDYFSDFGALTDIFLPAPFRGFAFVTFASESDGRRVLRMSHLLHGARLNVTLAEPKDEKPPRGQQQSYSSSSNPSNYTWNPSNRNNNHNNHGYKHEPNVAQFNQPEKPDVTADLKNMLFAFLSNQK